VTDSSGQPKTSGPAIRDIRAMDETIIKAAMITLRAMWLPERSIDPVSFFES